MNRPDEGPPAAEAAPGAATAVRRHAVRGVLWSLVGLAGNRGVSFAVTVVLARLVAPREFGVVAAGMAVMLYLEGALDLGVGAAVVYEQERGVTRRVRTAVSVTLLLGLAFFGAGALAAPIVTELLRVSGDATLFRVLFAYLPLRGATQIAEAVLRRDLRFRRRTVVGLVRAATRGAVSIPLAVAGHGAGAIVAGFLAGEAASAVIGWVLVGAVPRPAWDRHAARTMTRFGLSVTGLRLLSEVSINADYLVVGNRLGPERLGFYSVAFRLPELVIGSALWVYSSIAFPIYSHARELGRRAFRETTLRALALVTMFGFTTGTGLALVSRDAIPLLFGERWEPAVAPMAFIALAQGAHAIGYASGDVFPALGRPGVLLRVNVGLAVVSLAAFLATAPHGITAVAAAHLAVAAGYGACRIAIANRVVGTTLAESLAALRPAVVTSVCIALPGVAARALTDPGPGGLAAVVLAGAAGGAVGLLLAGRPVVTELRALAASARRDPRTPPTR